MRRDILRAGLREATRTLIDDLSAKSAEFRALWAEQDILAHGDRRKSIHHPQVGAIAFEYSTFDVDGRPDLALVVFNPITPGDRDKISRLIAD